MKQALRRRLKPAKPAPAAQAALEKRLLKEEWWLSAFSIGLYAALPSEVQTAAFFADAARLGCLISVPVSGKNGKYTFRFIENDVKWAKSANGILEPQASRPVPKNSLRVILVPGLAFDAAGTRLGRGGGHYDRLLAAFPDALFVGCAFESAFSAVPLPREPHDIPMDVILTEKRTHYLPTAQAKITRLLEGAPC